MIPLGTIGNPTQRRPYLTYSLLLINILVFFWEMTLPPAERLTAFYQLSIVPCEFVSSFGPVRFVDVLRGENTPMITGADGLAALRIALAVEESARTSTPVRL